MASSPGCQRRRCRSGRPGCLGPRPPEGRKPSSPGPRRDVPGRQVAGQDGNGPRARAGGLVSGVRGGWCSQGAWCSRLVAGAAVPGARLNGIDGALMSFPARRRGHRAHRWQRQYHGTTTQALTAQEPRPRDFAVSLLSSRPDSYLRPKSGTPGTAASSRFDGRHSAAASTYPVYRPCLPREARGRLSTGGLSVGVRVSKSFKVAPGVKVRVNAKSTSMPLGGKGARYTVNSKGRRTTTVGIPGSGLSVQGVAGTSRSAPRQAASKSPQNVVAAQTAPKPGLFAPKGEKRLYKILAADLGQARSAVRCEEVARQFPELRIAAATLAGLFALSESPEVAIRSLGYVVDSGVEVAGDSFLRRYAPVKAYAMDAGGGRKEFVPLSRELLIIWLAIVHLVAGNLEQAEATATDLKDTPVVRELRRKISAVRRNAANQAGGDQAVSPRPTGQAERLEEVHAGLAEIAQTRERVQSQIAALEQGNAKLGQLVSQARQRGREDLAQQALERQGTGQSQLDALRSQLDQLLAVRAQLTATAQALQAEIDGATGLAGL